MTHTITLNGGLKDVVLPNKLRYQGGATVVLSDAMYSQLSATWRASNLSADVASTDLGRLSLLAAPTGAKAETFPRLGGMGYTSSALVSGTEYYSLMPIPGGTLVSNLSFGVGTAAVTVSHAWAGLIDSSGVVHAISADSPGLGGWTAGFQMVTLPMGAAYLVPSTADYYVLFMIAAATMPQIAGTSIISGPGVTSPAMSGSAATGQTTPPALNATITGMTGSGNWRMYAYAS